MLNDTKGEHVVLGIELRVLLYKEYDPGSWDTFMHLMVQIEFAVEE